MVTDVQQHFRVKKPFPCMQALVAEEVHLQIVYLRTKPGRAFQPKPKLSPSLKEPHCFLKCLDGLLQATTVALSNWTHVDCPWSWLDHWWRNRRIACRSKMLMESLDSLDDQVFWIVYPLKGWHSSWEQSRSMGEITSLITMKSWSATTPATSWP